MEKPMCDGRRKSDIQHKQSPGIWVYDSDAHSKKRGAYKASPSPGTVGIIDGEREPLPE